MDEYTEEDCWCGGPIDMIDLERKCRIYNRIACEELGYPVSEALYSDPQEWEQATGLSWEEEWMTSL